MGAPGRLRRFEVARASRQVRLPTQYQGV